MLKQNSKKIQIAISKEIHMIETYFKVPRVLELVVQHGDNAKL